jgi:hypothetical protein
MRTLLAFIKNLLFLTPKKKVAIIDGQCGCCGTTFWRYK